MKNKKFIGLPEDGKDTVFFSISLAHSINKKPLTRDIVVDAFEKEGIEFTDEIKEEASRFYPEVKF